VTREEIIATICDAKRKAHAAARDLYSPGIGPTTPIVNAARLDVLEEILMGLLAGHSPYAGDLEDKKLLETRDYWELVADRIEITAELDG
jgi:hypothetical protein